jgi:two-component system sensor histidine kinase PilS (NtrC family)
MKAKSQNKIDWWIGGAFLVGLGAVAMDAQATYSGLLIVMLGLIAVIVGWRLPTRPERVRQHLDQLREAATMLCRNLPSGMMLVDQQNRVLFANEQALALFGGKPDEFQGSSLANWSIQMSNDPSTGQVQPARRFRKADGTTFYAHVSEAFVEMPEPDRDTTLRILIISDISTLVDLHHRVQQTERLRTAATMATQFAHEVRNPVAAISGSAQVLGKLQRQVLSQTSPSAITDSDRALLYECIVNESDRLDGIISKFLSVNEFSDARLEELVQVAENVANIGRPEHRRLVRGQPESIPAA